MNHYTYVKSMKKDERRKREERGRERRGSVHWAEGKEIVYEEWKRRPEGYKWNSLSIMVKPRRAYFISLLSYVGVPRICGRRAERSDMRRKGEKERRRRGEGVEGDLPVKDSDWLQSIVC